MKKPDPMRAGALVAHLKAQMNSIIVCRQTLVGFPEYTLTLLKLDSLYLDAQHGIDELLEDLST